MNKPTYEIRDAKTCDFKIVSTFVLDVQLKETIFNVTGVSGMSKANRYRLDIDVGELFNIANVKLSVEGALDEHIALLKKVEE